MADALLDTTFFIDLHSGDQGARGLWEQIESGGLTASFSTVTAFELWVGKHVAGDEERFYEALFFLLEEAALTRAAAQTAGAWLRPLLGRVPEKTARDALIAASASERGELVYTRDVADFQRFHPDVRRY